MKKDINIDQVIFSLVSFVFVSIIREGDWSQAKSDFIHHAILANQLRGLPIKCLSDALLKLNVFTAGWSSWPGIKRVWRRCGSLLLQEVEDPRPPPSTLRSPPQSAITAMEVAAGQGEPRDPWTNDPGPLITPVDAGTALLNNQTALISIAWKWSKKGILPSKTPLGGLSRAEEQLPCVIADGDFIKTVFKRFFSIMALTSHLLTNRNDLYNLFVNPVQPICKSFTNAMQSQISLTTVD